MSSSSSSTSRPLPPPPPSAESSQPQPSIYDSSTAPLASAEGEGEEETERLQHPPRIASLLNSTSLDDGWGGLISDSGGVVAASKTEGEKEVERKEEEELLRRVRSLENRKSNASKLAQELHDLEARLAAAEEKERSLRGDGGEPVSVGK